MHGCLCVHCQLDLAVENFLGVEEVLDMEQFLVVGCIGRVHQVLVDRTTNFEWLAV